jgi:hypothetical protein
MPFSRVDYVTQPNPIQPADRCNDPPQSPMRYAPDKIPSQIRRMGGPRPQTGSGRDREACEWFEVSQM